MNFLELLLLIEERKEKTLTHTVEYIITAEHRYLHLGANDWQEDMFPGGPKEYYTRGGAAFRWERAEEVAADVKTPWPDDKADAEEMAKLVAFRDAETDPAKKAKLAEDVAAFAQLMRLSR